MAIWLGARAAGNHRASAASAVRVRESRGKNSSGSVTATDASRGASARPPASAASQIPAMTIARRNEGSVPPVECGGDHKSPKSAPLGAPELERLAGHARVGDDLRALRELALEDLQRERVLEHALDHALERARPVVRVVALLGEEVLC